MALEYILYTIIAILTIAVAMLWRSKGGDSAELNDTISQMAGRLQTMQENITTQNANLNQTLTQNLGQTAKETQENLSKLNERLVVIDQAQSNIQTLAKDVVGLQAILQNKQTRGAFGQKQMEMIIQDGLPKGQYEFQATLSNNTRPDCLIKMPNDSPDLIVDAKFPLEAWNRMRDPNNVADTQMHKEANTSFKNDVQKHIKDIAEKYLIAGETQDTALLFIPSESIFAELHENFEAVIEFAYKKRIMIVSPTHLSLAIRVFQSMLKDTKTREQAHLIQKQVGEFMKDLERLDDRIGKLKTHNDQTTKDIDAIMTSTRKLNRHGEKIEELEFEEKPNDTDSPNLID